MSENEEDDKPTVVLDLKALKEEAKQQQETLEDISSDLEFSATTDATDASDADESTPEKAKVLLFDFNSDYFQKTHSKFPQAYDYIVLKTLPELNKELGAEGNKVVVFNYNAAPKAVNQLCAQIKAKFPSAKTLIMAKNLSPEKAQAHRQSKSGANGYVSAPFKLETLDEELKKLSTHF